jgi:uncharacterized pyridoxamine 5'-phosphate oxidase family protein
VRFPAGFKSLVEKNALALATVGARGPHVVGVAFVKLREGKLIVTNNYMRSTVRNIALNPRVALAVWDKKWHGCEVFGRAKHYTSGKWLRFVRSLKENAGEPCRGALVITPTAVRKLA